MATCPNLSNPTVKKQFDELVNKHGENAAYYLWDKYKGLPPKAVRDNRAFVETYFKERFGEDSLFIKESLQNLPNAQVFGYVQNAAAYLGEFAPVSDAYHEAFHLFFRTSISDKNRAQLLNEASKKFGEPTAEELEYQINMQPELTVEEARDLVLEERMAEAFRDYSIAEDAPKTLGAKLKNFFKKLWVYVQALAKKPLTMRNAFFMIDKNALSPRILRDASKFSGNRAYMIREFAQNRLLHEELTAIGAKRVIDNLDERLKKAGDDRNEVRRQGSVVMNQVLGDARSSGESRLRNWYLRMSVSTHDGRMLSNEEFEELKNLFLADDVAGLQEFFDRDIVDEDGDTVAQFVQFPPVYDTTGEKVVSKKFVEDETLPEDLEEERLDRLSQHFQSVFKYWYDSVDSNGRVQRGFRSDIIDKLADFGIKAIEREGKNIVTDEIGEVERIYSISRLQENPAEKLSEKQRILLSRIPVEDTTKSYTGLESYIPAVKVYRALIEAAADTKDFNDMMNSIQVKSLSNPYMKRVHDFINNLDVVSQASLYNAFNLASHEFTTVEIGGDGNGATNKIFSPNVNGVEKQFELMWRRGSVLPGGPLIKRVNKEGNIIGYEMAPERRERIKELATSIGITNRGLLSSTQLDSDQQADLARLFLAMGYEIAQTEAEAIDRVQAVLQDKISDTKLPLKSFLSNDTIIGKVVSDIFNDAPFRKNYLEDESKTSKALVRAFVAPFEVSKAMSFLNIAMKSIYPINLKARLNNEAIRVKNGELRKDLQGTIQHDFGGRRSLLFKLLSSPDFVKQHKFVDVDGIKISNNDSNYTREVEDLSYTDVLGIRMAKWLNQGNKKFGSIILDTHGDRQKLPAGFFPKSRTRLTKGQYNFSINELNEIFEDEIMLDLNRMREARLDIENAVKTKDFSKLVEGYHYGMKGEEMDFSRGGWTTFNAFNFKLPVDENGLPTTFNGKSLITLLEDVSASMEKQTQLGQSSMSAVLTMINMAKEEIEQDIEAVVGKLKENGHTLESFSKTYLDAKSIGDVKEFLREFVTYDRLGRLVYRQMFRDGANFTKDSQDFVKRAQLISTPGTQGVIQGRLTANGHESYGLPPTFNATTIRDVFTSLPEESLLEFESRLAKIYNPEAAKEITDSYRNKRIQSTDAQAFISPSHWYSLKQYRGQTTEVIDDAMRRYFAAPKGEAVWDPRVPIVVMKPSYDGRIVKDMGRYKLSANYSDKTSYVTLTDELVKGIPVLENLLDRMEARGRYAGQKPIQVVHTESAQKLARVPGTKLDMTGTQDLSSLVIQEMDSQYLRFPEDTPVKRFKEEMLLGRQAKVNMLTNIKDDDMYMYNAGLGELYEEGVTGLELKRIFHRAVAEKLNKNLSQIYAELGYDQVLAAREYGTNEDVKQALKEMKTKLVAKLKDMSIEKSFNMATIDALAQSAETGDTTLPLGYANLQGKFDQLLFSIFRNNAYKQMVKGVQTVQFADMGGVKFDDSLEQGLKFLEIDGERVVHAEVDLRADFLERIGIPKEVIDRALSTGNTNEINESLKRVIGYRIPQQGKNSLLIMKIRRLLPKSHDGAVRVPAGITTMMGSDFDIDKLFIMYPEAEVTEEGVVQKLRVPYSELKADLNNVANLSEQQLNTIFFDTFETVASSLHHLHETITPLDGRDLSVARDESIYAESDIDAFSTANSVQSFVNNMFSHRLRGTYANAVLGRNAVMGSLIPQSQLRYNNTTYGEDSLVFIEEGRKRETETLEPVALFPDVEGAFRPSDYFMSLHLGAAVDSVKDPLQYAINDNKVTAKLYVYMYSRGLTTRQAVAFLNHPVIRKVTTGALVSGMSLSKMIDGYLSDVKRELEGVPGKEFASVVSRNGTFDFPAMREEARSYDAIVEESPMEAYEYLLKLQRMNTMASDLTNLYRAATPFTIDKSGTTAQNLAMLDELEYYLYSEGDGGIYGNKEIISKMLLDDKYESARSYYKAIKSSVQFVTEAGFVANQKGMKIFRNALSALNRGNPLKEQVQSMVLNMARLAIATKPGSALYEQGYIDRDYVEQMHLSKENNIHTLFGQVKKILQFNNVSNAFIESLSQHEENYIRGKKLRTIYSIAFDNTLNREASEEDAITAGWEALYFNTGQYFDAEEAAVLKNFAKAMITNTIITTGMAPGPKSLAGLISPLILEDIGVTEDYNNGIQELQNNAGLLLNNYFEKIVKMYANTSIGRRYSILGNYSAYGMQMGKLEDDKTVVLRKGVAKNLPRFLTLAVGRSSAAYEVQIISSDKLTTTVRFTKLPKFGIPQKFYEINIKDYDGNPTTKSIIFDGTEQLTQQAVSTLKVKPVQQKSLEQELSDDSIEGQVATEMNSLFEGTTPTASDFDQPTAEDFGDVVPRAEDFEEDYGLQFAKEMEAEARASRVVEGDIFREDGIPVITTNLGGVHGAGLAQSAAKLGLIKKGDGKFKATSQVVQLPVKKHWRETVSVKNGNLKLLAEGLAKLIKIANSNQEQTFLLPLAGLGHGEGKVEEIMPLLIKTLDQAQNIQLVLPAENVDIGKQAKVRTDSTRQKMPQIKQMLEDAGYWNNLGDVITGFEESTDEAPFSRTIDLLGAEKEMPRTLNQKINRLKESFKAAGVDVQVVLDILPEGIKGMVDNGIVILDPNQVTTDTVYHELGHILVDMLPQNEVDRYIQQVVDADPDLAMLVADSYPDLNGRDLGKEILVTAIGMEGAKIERQQPTRLQRIINAILRAIGKLFGIKPNAAAVLAEKMFAGDIRKMALSSTQNVKIQQSRSLKRDVDSAYQEAYKHLERRLRDMKYGAKDETTEFERVKIKELQSTLVKMSETKNSIDAFVQFKDFVESQVIVIDNKLSAVEAARNKPVSKDKALQLLRDVDMVRETLETLYNSNKSKSLTDEITNVLKRSMPEFPTKDQELGVKVISDLTNALLEMQTFEDRYIDNALPLVADVLTEYGDTDLDEKIQSQIDNIIKTRNTNLNAYESSDPEIIALRKKKKGMIAQGRLEEWEDAVIQAKVEHLKNKKSGRENIIKELQSSYKDKSLFSLYLDPIIYSTQSNLQLFAMTLKEGDIAANQRSIALRRSMEQAYKNYKAYRGTDFNKNTFYDPFLTTVNIKNGDTSTKVLSIVQPFDTERFYGNIDKMYKTMWPKHKHPGFENKDAYDKWRDSDAFRAYQKDVSTWWKSNTVPVKDAKEKLQAMVDERNAKYMLLDQMEELQDSTAIAIIEAEIQELNREIGSSYDSVNNVFKGKLAQPNSSYYNEKYLEIQRVPQLKEFYDALVGIYKERQVNAYGKSNPQYKNAWDEFSYIAPSLRQSQLESYQNQGFKGYVKEMWEDVTEAETDQELYGAAFDQDDNPVKYLPRFYTNVVDEKEVTRDILSSVLAYSHKAYHYEEKAKLTGLVNAMLNIYERREVLRTDTSGRSLLSREAERVKEAFGESFIGRTAATYLGDKSNTLNHLSQFIDVAFYGIIKKPLETKILGMDPNKLAVKINSMSALGSLSFNLLQIGNQAILDTLMLAEEGVAADFYTSADVRFAEAEFVRQGAGARDLGKFNPETKLGKAMLHFNALHDVTDNYGGNASDNKALKMMSTDNLFFVQSSIEYQTSAVRMLAAMNATRGKMKDSAGNVIMNADGTEASLWDLMIETEKGLELDPRVDKAQSNYSDIKFVSKLHGISKRTNQIKGTFDSSTAVRGPVGILLMLYKQFFIPNFRKRFGHGQEYHVDHELGSITRGAYFSYIDFLKQIKSSLKSGAKISELYADLSDVDKANLRRVHMDAAIVASSMAIFAACMSILDDDDDDENYWVAFTAYQARRLQTELLAYVPGAGFGELITIFKSPMAAANRAEKTWDFVNHVIGTEIPYSLSFNPSEALTKDAIYQRDSYWGEEGTRKTMGKLKKILPVFYGASTLDKGAIEDKIGFFDK